MSNKINYFFLVFEGQIITHTCNILYYIQHNFLEFKGKYSRYDFIYKYNN